MQLDSQNPPVRLLATFQTMFPDAQPALIQSVPGRDLWGAVRFNGAPNFRLIDSEGGRASFDYQSARRRLTLHQRPLPRWTRYAAGACVLLEDLMMPGFDLVVAGAEPAGVRRDHALGMLFANVCYELNGMRAEDDDLQALIARVRQQYIEGDGR